MVALQTLDDGADRMLARVVGRMNVEKPLIFRRLIANMAESFHKADVRMTGGFVE